MVNSSNVIPHQVITTSDEHNLILEASNFEGQSWAAFVRVSALNRAREILIKKFQTNYFLKNAIEKESHPLNIELKPIYENKITHLEEIH